VGVAKLVGLDSKQLLVQPRKVPIRWRIGGRYQSTLTSAFVDLDQSVVSWTANMEETLELGGSLGLAG
jgi:hypothetical protein